MMDRHAQAFLTEAEEILTELESALLELENSPGDTEIIGRVFRAMHTLKGSSAMFGFDTIAAFTHNIETLYDLIRDGHLSVSHKIIDLTLKACDQIKILLDCSRGGGAQIDHTAMDRLVREFEALLPVATPSGSPPPDGGHDNKIHLKAHPPENSRRYRIDFRPEAGIFTSGMDPALLLDELRELGECSVKGNIADVPLLDELNPEQCFIAWTIFLHTDQGMNAIHDVFIFVEDESDISVQEINETFDEEDDGKLPRIGEILLERREITPLQLKAALSQQKKIGEILVESGAISADKIEAALQTQQKIGKQQPSVKTDSVRVPAERLDKLINLVGELVITQARLSQVAAQVNAVEMTNPIEEIEYLTQELRDCVLNIRMLPIGTNFSKFKRLVRDLSIELGKEVDILTEGGETELDKTVLDRLNDPLVHLIRNSIDHGIELGSVRRKMGKKQRGIIRLAAAHSGNSVVIVIEDDGAGLDPEAIRSKAVAKGLIKPDTELTEPETFKLIFTPGFSTAQAVTSVSGRGVGMDVVKRVIEDLRGSIEVSSKRNQGTKITLKLPLTLAIIDGLLVRVDSNRFILPLAAVEECVELSTADILKAHNRHVIPVRGELVPYVRLREFFTINGSKPKSEHIAIVQAESSRIGIVVDEIIGDHQTVIKSLGNVYRDAEGVSGATILGDGEIALILDVSGIIQCAEREEGS